MNVAVFYTGESRTFESTIELFRQNVLLNDRVHVFAVVQDNIGSASAILAEYMGAHLKKFISFDKDDVQWTTTRETLLRDMDISPNWKNYLRNSGSMIEYYQMHLAFLAMHQFEIDNNMTYDYVIRCRTDTIVKDPLHFNWKQYTDDDIRQLLQNIVSTDPNNTISVFMNSLFNPNRANYRDIHYDDVVSKQVTELIKMDQFSAEFVQKICAYLNDGNFVVGFRVNVLYVTSRTCMEKIHRLGVEYGKSTYRVDEYWFNAECQLKQICVDNGIDFFSSTTNLENLSLYEYDRQKYYQPDNTLQDDDYSFFIKRT